ncbi:hypothetical protein GXY_11943 [Novacetimonas hansenii ATCC 23769]|uniref:Uncharacterized protein n=5 Tax=Acetobacteraceae TaxID=433 RepID=D5QHC1_NOVHA|nr:hypothetical protein GXY_11943 [Novacetimonas hansenii ATCC 23769]
MDAHQSAATIKEKGDMYQFTDMLFAKTNILMGQLKHEIGRAAGSRNLQARGIAQKRRGRRHTERVDRIHQAILEQGGAYDLGRDRRAHLIRFQ